MNGDLTSKRGALRAALDHAWTLALFVPSGSDDAKKHARHAVALEEILAEFEAVAAEAAVTR